MSRIKPSITNHEGISFNVRLVGVGDRYGRDNCLVNEDEPMVEFYDARFTKKFGQLGQFVSRYDVSTFLELDGTGLCLDGAIEAWQISHANVIDVRQWINRRET